ncbi:MAG: MarR family winged helix-turn-helix transcriptional regulator [Pseudomonadales bacterium]
MTDELLNPGHCVGLNLYKTARAVSRVYAEEMRPAGLARSQFAILGTLERSGPTALSTLAEALYMDRTTLTRNLKPLEKAGFAVRHRSETDARVSLVEITASGRDKFREARRYWRQAQRRMLELLGEDEWRALESKLLAVRELAAEEAR